MARTPSTMVELGRKLPGFRLPDTSGRLVSDVDFSGQPLLVMFICNHCPFVVHIREVLAKKTSEWMKLGLGVVGINSNDVVNYPDDSPDKMVLEKARANYEFAYLFDETQAVAKAFDAACTPDFFLFDRSHKLVYRGQFDASRPNSGIPVTGEDLNRAVRLCLDGKAIDSNQLPSLGCNIKWKLR